MGQNRTTASIGLAVALSLAAGGAGGYFLGREHGAEAEVAAADASDCRDARRAFEEALDEVGNTVGRADYESASPEEQDAAAFARTKTWTIVDQNPSCFDAGTRADATTYLEGE